MAAIGSVMRLLTYRPALAMRLESGPAAHGCDNVATQAAHSIDKIIRRRVESRMS